MAMPGDVLDYSVAQEVRGAMHDGRLRLSSQNITFRDTKTGKVKPKIIKNSIYTKTV